MRKQEVIEDLPDPTDDEVVENAKAIVEFVGQAWIEGEARNVEDGEITFSVPLKELRECGEWAAINETCSRHYVDDTISSHSTAPGAVKKWSGPFRIKYEGWSLYEIGKTEVVPRSDLEKTAETQYGSTYTCPRCGYKFVTEYCDCPQCQWAGMCQTEFDREELPGYTRQTVPSQ